MSDNIIFGENIIHRLEDYLRIRYIKLHFDLEILEDGYLPPNKTSAIRGGMGHMLLEMNCMFDKKCDSCDFRRECIVRSIMYPEMKIRPDFMTNQDSEGYVLECEDHKTFFRRGQCLKFNLLLFGGTIAYFTHILHAFCLLGSRGLGKDSVHFRVKSVKNTLHGILYDGDEDIVYKDRYQIMYVSDYVKYRLSQYEISSKNTIIFHTPLTLKHRGIFQNFFNMEAIMAGAERRIFILNCFEGTPVAKEGCRIQIEGHIPVKTEEIIQNKKIKRYSGTQNTKMLFSGMTGYCRLEEMDQTALILLLAGELLHIGKNTSFGFGRYTLNQLPS